MTETIGFIGLGALGLPMATNLLKAGYALRVYNRTASKADSLVAEGAYLASTPADAIPAGGFVASIVWDGDAVESIVNSEGLLERLGSGIHIMMSTIPPETSKHLAAIHAQHGSTYIESPIFGRPDAAVARGLFIPVAGPQAAKERVRPILEAMGGKGIFDMGEEIGAAVLTKLIGNFMLMSMGHTMHEGAMVARKSGVDPQMVMNMLTGSLFDAPIFKSYGNRVATSTTPYTQTAIPLKDVGIFKQTASEVDSPAPIASLVLSLLQAESV